MASDRYYTLICDEPGNFAETDALSLGELPRNTTALLHRTFLLRPACSAIIGHVPIDRDRHLLTNENVKIMVHPLEREPEETLHHLFATQAC